MCAFVSFMVRRLLLHARHHERIRLMKDSLKELIHKKKKKKKQVKEEEEAKREARKKKK